MSTIIRRCIFKMFVLRFFGSLLNSKIILKAKFSYFLLIFSFPVPLFACSCGLESLVNKFQQSEFVAKAKIIKITPDPTNSEYHDAVIKITNLYKGEHLNKIKIMSSLNSSCSFLPLENSTWIIFAQRWQGTLSFGFCSGSIDMDQTFDPIQYPNAAKNYCREIKLKEGVISFLSKKGIFNPNPSLLRANNSEIESLKGYKNKNSFAAFQVDVNSDFSIAAIQQLKKLKNAKLNKLILNSMKTKLKVTGRRGRPLTKPERIFVICYFYQQSGTRQSYLSLYNF